MSEQKQPLEEERELLETPDQDEDFIEPPLEEEEARRPEQRSWQEDKQDISREIQKKIEDRPEVPKDAVGRLDRPEDREETIKG
jgi:hypothetical protein